MRRPIGCSTAAGRTTRPPSAAVSIEVCKKGAHRLVRAFAISISSLQPAADALHIALHALNEQRGVEAVYVQASIISSYTLTIIAVYLSASRK